MPGRPRKLAQPVVGKKTKKTIKDYQDLQDILGEHQDAVVAADLLRRLGVGTAGHSDENWFTYGLLYALEMSRADDSRRHAEAWAGER